MDEVTSAKIEKRLKEYRVLCGKANIYAAKVEGLEYDISMTGPAEIKTFSFDKAHVQGGKCIHGTIDAYNAMVDDAQRRAADYEALRDEYQRQADELLDGIMAAPLDDEEMEYIRLRYLEGWPVWKLCQECCYSESTALRVKNRAFDRLEFMVEE
jgi:hypothetical protein